jgi:ankyrin repeat protein
MADVFEAVAAGDLARVKELIGADPALARARDGQGLTPILHARYRDDMEMVRALLATNPDLDVFEGAALGDEPALDRLLDSDPGLIGAWSGDGFTPLHLAAFFGHPETAALLIQRGADVAAVSRNPMTVMPLHSAVAGRDARTVEVLLGSGADVNAPSHAGFTPLLDAAQNGDPGIVEVLLARGADPEQATEAGKRARDLALEQGHQDVADLLEERG